MPTYIARIDWTVTAKFGKSRKLEKFPFPDKQHFEKWLRRQVQTYLNARTSVERDYVEYYGKD